MMQEMEALEAERLKEEQELKAAYQKELKYNKYLEDQRSKLAEHRMKKAEEQQKKAEQDALAKRKEKQRLEK